MPTDYSLIVLTDEESAVFKKFKKVDSVFLTSAEHRLLERKGLVIAAVDGKSTWFEDPSDGISTLSQKGKELRSYQKQHNKEIWLVNAKIPIIVSFITTLAVNWLLPMLSQIVQSLV